MELIAELTGPDAEERSKKVLSSVGLADRMDHFPGELSVFVVVAMLVTAALSLIPAPRTVRRLQIGEVVRERAA